MLTLTENNAMGFKKLAHRALSNAIRSLSFKIAAEERAVAKGVDKHGVPTLDMRNEMDINAENNDRDDVEGTGPAGFIKKRSSWVDFYNLYLGISTRLEMLDKEWALTMPPAKYIDFVFAAGKSYTMSPAREAQLQQAAEAMDVPVSMLIEGETAKMLRNNAGVLARKEIILSELAKVSSSEGFESIDTFEAHEQADLLQALVSELESRKDTYIKKGYAINGMATVVLMKEDIAEAKMLLKKVAA